MPVPTLVEEQIAFFREYGRAMSAWTSVENAMHLVTEHYIPEGMPRNMIAMGLTGIQGFHSKRLFIERCVKRGIQARTDADALLPDWDSLLERADSLSKKRNDLAHFLTIPFPENEPGRRFALCPWYGPKSAPKDKPPSDAYCVKELIRTEREFVELLVDFLNFAYRLHNIPQRLERSAPPQVDLPTIQQTIDQMHEELGHQRLSAQERKRQEDARNAAASLRDFPETPNGDKTGSTAKS